MTKTGHTRFIVCLGASAGGLEALERFFRSMPADSNMTFIVVTHQHAGHVTLLPSLLGRCTPMPVEIGNDGVTIRPNHVYLTAPGTAFGFSGDVLRVQPLSEERGIPLPIDTCFRSLADAYKDRAVAIILSGTGTDGTLGLKLVKAEGGLVLAQEPQTAKYGHMAQSAIQTGLVDAVLPVERMPEQLSIYARRGESQRPEPSPSAEEAQWRVWQRTLDLLRQQTGHDFSGYKTKTLFRRLDRRMGLRQLTDLHQYNHYLEEHPEEVAALFKDWVISVTTFFRDPEAFQALARKALPKLVASKPEGDTLRVWSVGCATGEEAYSLAIVLAETLERHHKRCPVKIFATDPEAHALQDARHGIYPVGISADVTPERLSRFFLKEENHYQIKGEIREMVVFAKHNVLMDPPFTHVDLISCRNVLIYLEPEFQRRAIQVFRYALQPGGILFLGNAETLGRSIEAFTTIDQKAKIFLRKPDGRERLAEDDLGLPILRGAAAPGSAPKARPPEKRPPDHTGLAGAVESLLLRSYAPPSVVFSERGDIVYIHGRTGAYLEPAPGPADQQANLFRMARKGVRRLVEQMVREAAARSASIVREGVRVKTNGGHTRTNLRVRRIAELPGLEHLFVLSFEPSTMESPVPEPGGQAAPAGGSQAEQRLERELKLTKADLQNTVEELETSNEELKSSNEELQSTNEELQSTNEELEASKEELQSVNEEFQNANQQLEKKVEELAGTKDDLQNLLDSTSIAILFLNKRLQIRRFNPQAKKLFNLIPGDLGRPLADLASNLEYEPLLPDVHEVLETLAFKERQVQGRDGAWYNVRIRPYRTSEDVIDGIVITFSDITKVKADEFTSRLARRHAERVLDAVPQPVLVLDETCTIVSANQAFVDYFELTADEVKGRSLWLLGQREWDTVPIRECFDGAFQGDERDRELSITQTFTKIGPRTIRLQCRRLETEDQISKQVLVSITDHTARAPDFSTRSGTKTTAKRRRSPAK